MTAREIPFHTRHGSRVPCVYSGPKRRGGTAAATAAAAAAAAVGIYGGARGRRTDGAGQLPVIAVREYNNVRSAASSCSACFTTSYTRARRSVSGRRVPLQRFAIKCRVLHGPKTFSDARDMVMYLHKKDRKPVSPARARPAGALYRRRRLFGHR